MRPKVICQALPLLMMLVLSFAPKAGADTEYKYQGQPYYLCLGSYGDSSDHCLGAYALSITFETPYEGAALEGLNRLSTGLMIPVDSFSMTDGSGLLITQANAVADGFSITTDASGDITGWFIVAYTDVHQPISYYVQTATDGDLVPEASSTCCARDGQGDGTATGTWTMMAIPLGSGTGVPEPSTLLLVGVGMFGAGAGALRRKHVS
jgi:hypothetical protein